MQGFGLRATTGKAFTMTETLSAIVKRHCGVDPLALAIVHKGRSEGITEAELTQVATEQAKREWPDLSEAAAFTRRYAERAHEAWRSARRLTSARPARWLTRIHFRRGSEITSAFIS
jgi:hypothetical protein